VASRSTKTSRWLDLIAFLLAHRFPVTRDEIFENVSGYLGKADSGAEREDGSAAAVVTAAESARRKFERDKDELRALGIAIETVDLPASAGDEPGQGYRLRPGDFYLPYLELEATASGETRPYPALRCIEVSPEDLAVLDRATRLLAERTNFPLQRAAASVRKKLAFDLPLSIRSVERVLSGETSAETVRTLEVLQQAVAQNMRVRCRYYSIGRDVEEEREIEPHGLFFHWGYWYCVARPAGTEEWRVFRVDRVTDAHTVRPNVGQFERDPAFSIKDYVGRAAWQLGERPIEQVRVQFVFPESRWVIARDLGRVVVPMTEDGSAEIEFDVRERNPLLRWLLTFRDHVEVLDPTDFAEQLADLRARVAALYQRPGSA
jgi:proteasome accessory factor B